MAYLYFFLLLLSTVEQPALLELVSPTRGTVLGAGEVAVVVALDGGGAAPRAASLCVAFDGPFTAEAASATMQHCVDVMVAPSAATSTLFVAEGLKPGTHSIGITLRFASGGVAASVGSFFDVIPAALRAVAAASRPPLRCRAKRRVILAAWGSLRYGGQQSLALAQARHLPRACYEYHYLHAEPLRRDDNNDDAVPLRAAFVAAGATLRYTPDLRLPRDVLFATLEELLAQLPDAESAAHARALSAWLASARVDVLIVPNTLTTQTVALLAIAKFAGVAVRVLELPNRDPPAAAAHLASALVAPSRSGCSDAAARALGLQCFAIAPVALDLAAQLPRCAGDAGAGLACGRREMGAPGQRATVTETITETVVVGFIGRLAPVRAPGLFLRVAAAATARLQQRKLASENARKGEAASVALLFVVVGGGPARTALMRHAAALGLRLNDSAPSGVSVRFLGPLFPATAALSVIDIFLNPATTETFGIATVEALAAGACVVACRYGPTPEIVSHDRDGLLVDCGESATVVDRFADAVLELVLNQTKRRAMALAGRLGAASAFSAQRFVERHDEMYAGLLSEAYVSDWA